MVQKVLFSNDDDDDYDIHTIQWKEDESICNCSLTIHVYTAVYYMFFFRRYSLFIASFFLLIAFPFYDNDIQYLQVFIKTMDIILDVQGSNEQISEAGTGCTACGCRIKSVSYVVVRSCNRF
jgi:hypothetical protein